MIWFTASVTSVVTMHCPATDSTDSLNRFMRSIIGPEIVKTLRLDRTQVAAVCPCPRHRDEALDQTTGNRAHPVQRRACHHFRPQLERATLRDGAFARRDLGAQV